MIKVKDLSKVYGETQVLHSLTFDVQPGQLMGLLGPNGSGKSTTMDILGGLLGPTDGSVSICGYDVVSESLNARGRISYLRDNPGLYLDSDVESFISYMGSLRGLSHSEQKRATNRVIEECEIEDVRGRIIGHLSKGFRQRVALAASLVHQPDVIILDEPTDGLDPTQIFLFRKLVRRIAEKRAVILSSHILSEVQAVCTDVVIIQKGHLAYKGSLKTLNQEESQTYLLSSSVDSEHFLNWAQMQSDVVHCSVREPHVFSVTFQTGSVEQNRSKFLTNFLEKGFSLSEFYCERKSLETIYLETLSSEKKPLLKSEEQSNSDSFSNPNVSEQREVNYETRR